MLKYEETRLRILDYIRRQRLHPGDPLPSQLDLVKICNCSLITVKRALSHLQRTGIIERSQGRTARIRSLKETSAGSPCRKQHCPGEAHPGPRILLLQIYYSFWSIFEEQCLTELYLREHGCSLVYEKAMVPREMEDYDFSGITGVIFYGWVTPEWVNLIRRHGIPCIVAGNNYCPDLIKSINYDYGQGAALLYDTLRREGCRRIGLIAAGPFYLHTQVVRKVWLDRMAGDGIADPDPLHFIGDDRNAAISESRLRDFLLNANCDGLIVQNPDILPVLVNLYDLRLTDKFSRIGFFTLDTFSLPFNMSHDRIFILSHSKLVVASAAAELLAAAAENRPMRSRKIPFHIFPN